VAISGYTNAGKSALLNRLTGASAATADVLFATLDPTVRRTAIGSTTVTLTDTVGFVRNLPHQLVDAAACDALGQITTVHGVLQEIGAGGVPELLVHNKVDIAPAEWLTALQRALPNARPQNLTTSAFSRR